MTPSPRFTLSLATLPLAALPLTAIAEVPRVLVDTPALHSITAQVMAGVGTPDLLLPPGASPHDYALRPSDAAALSQANLIFWVGPGLTFWLTEPIETLGAQATQIALLNSTGWPTLPLRDWDDGHDHGQASAHSEEDDHDTDHDDDHDADHDDEHSDDHDANHDDHGDEHDDEHHDDHGDDHEAGHDDHDDHSGNSVDPHAWLDPQVASAWASTIADALAAQDPDNAAQYQQNALSFAEMNTQLISDLTAQLAPYSGQGYVVPHDAFQYFEVRFDMPASGTISLSDAQMPTPSALATLKQEVEQDQIGCILTDVQTSTDWANLVAEGTSARPVSADPAGSNLAAGPELYDMLLRNLADALETCLIDG